MSKLNVAVLYGGRSPEHEVSVISALQVMQNLDKSKYNILPIYIAKSGKWILGNAKLLRPEVYKDLAALESTYPETSLVSKKTLSLAAFSVSTPLPKIDIVFPVFHGPYGEDGCTQGLLEMSALPYVGCGVLASSIAMDKLAQKMVFAAAGIPQVKSSINHEPSTLHYPLFVKPANGGSSIGVTKVKSAKELPDAIEVAKCYDRRIVIEESAEGFMEINISVLGNAGHELKTSVCEQPVASNEVLTYQDKYQSSSSKSAGMASAKRLIPAPIKPATAKRIAEYAKRGFEAIDGSGLARIDFLVSPNEKTIYINEVNPMPGSLAFYLWEKTDLPFPKLLDELILLAQQRFAEKSQKTYTFSSNILANLGNTLKGGKVKG